MQILYLFRKTERYAETEGLRGQKVHKLLIDPTLSWSDSLSFRVCCPEAATNCTSGASAGLVVVVVVVDAADSFIQFNIL